MKMDNDSTTPHLCEYRYNMAITKTFHISPLRRTLYGKRLHNSPKLRRLDKILRRILPIFFEKSPLFNKNSLTLRQITLGFLNLTHNEGDLRYFGDRILMKIEKAIAVLV
jgi:hypothetical protein